MNVGHPGADTLKFTKTLTWNADGSPATVNEGSDTLSYAYDAAGRLSQFKRGATVLTAYTYTPATGTIATRTDGTLGAVTFTYDWARRQTVIDPPDSYATGTVTRSYRLDGLLATQSFPASITETLGYDQVKRPVSISLGAAGSLSQTFDRAGRVTADGRSLTGFGGDAGTGSQSFTYDALSRLTGSTGLADSRSYQYDLDGNRTRRVEGSVTTDNAHDRADQLTSQDIGAVHTTFDYDRYGNLVSGWDATGAQSTYAYDEASRLTTISPPGGAASQVTFSIDALDRHATRAVNGSTTDTYAYVDAAHTAWQTGVSGATGSLLDAAGSRLAVKTAGTTSWLVFDLHGSVTGLCTGTSALTDTYRFDGFGVQIAASGTATNPFRYRGLLNIGADAVLGALLDMGARDYSPGLGVFTQEDSVRGAAANPLTMNRFLYALADPATLIDPDGHMVPSVDDCGRDCFSAPPPNSSGPPDERASSGGGGNSGGAPGSGPINPWALQQDPIYTDVRMRLWSECQGFLLPDLDACGALKELVDLEGQNRQEYCAGHTAECRELEAAENEANALLVGLTAETVAFIIMAVEPVPGDEAIPAAAAAGTTAARAGILDRFARLLSSNGLFTKLGARPGTTVLGHGVDGYEALAGRLQATYYHMPTWLYDGIRSDRLRWAFNRGFLDARVKAGDVFQLTSKPRWDGWFKQEYDYLIDSKGYWLDEATMTLRRPGS